MILFTCTILLLVLNILGISGQDIQCDNNLNCSKNALCLDGICKCILSDWNGEKCLTYATEYNDVCEERFQCEWLGDNANCIKGVCKCNPNYRWYQGKCQKYVGKGGNCNLDIDCFDKINPLALKCESKKCVCNDGYYDRGSDCRLASQEKGSCSINYDCNPKGGSNLICHLGKCIKSNNVENSFHLEEFVVSYLEELLLPEKQTFLTELDEVQCNRDSDCRIMINSICNSTTNTCQCKSDKYINHGGYCLPGFDTCNVSSSCDSSYPNTECFHGVCVCKPGYFLQNKQCIPELGMPDLSLKNDNCKIKPGQFHADLHACYCIDYWFGDETNRECTKTTLQQTYSCLSNDWCNAMGPYSFCNSSGLCQCSSFATLNDKFYCEGEPTEDVCLRDSNCSYHERCQYEKCTCIENFSDIEGKCLPDLGGQCESDESCAHQDNSICISGLCACNINYLKYQKECLKIVDNWNDECEVTQQCEHFNFSQCSQKTKKCTCIKGWQRQRDNQCWELKDYGDPCMTSLQCTMPLNKYYQCRNNKCLCPIGQTLENGFCVTSSTFFYEPSLLLLLSIVFGNFII